MRNKIQQVGLAVLAATHLAHAAEECRSSYKPCQPAGATASAIPATGPQLAPLYGDLLGAVEEISSSDRRRNSAEKNERPLESRDDAPSLCCNENLTCLNVPGFDVAMCYDQFTTNFRLADGSTGNLASGAFSGSDGGSADLRAGTYEKGASSGSLYTGAAASYSPTDSAAIPAVYTASGVGSAVPISELGDGYITTTVTVSGTTKPGTTVTARVSGGTTIAGTTRDGTTVTAPYTTTITTPVGTAAPLTSSSKGGVDSPRPTGQVVGLLGVAAVAILL